jgi:hypothetical protein
MKLCHLERDHCEHRNKEHVRQIGNYAVADEFQGGEHLTDENLCVTSRPRKKPQDQRCVEIQSDENQNET